MIIIDATKYGSIDQALKVYKNKVTKTKLINQLRERQAYVKPSVARRKEILGAVYKQKEIDSSNG
jgi:small subunit ribosomal protein S21